VLLKKLESKTVELQSNVTSSEAGAWHRRLTDRDARLHCWSMAPPHLSSTPEATPSGMPGEPPSIWCSGAFCASPVSTPSLLQSHLFLDYLPATTALNPHSIHPDCLTMGLVGTYKHLKFALSQAELSLLHPDITDDLCFFFWLTAPPPLLSR
jgi:hypothetical protein